MAMPPVAALLRDSFLAVDSEIERSVHAAGFEEVQPGHGIVLRHLGTGGSHPSEIASRARVTRQAVTKAVDDLERLGLVTRESDPADGRAIIVRYTDRGREGLAAARATLHRIDAEMERAVGRERWETTLGVLAEIIARFGNQPRPDVE